MKKIILIFIFLFTNVSQSYITQIQYPYKKIINDIIFIDRDQQLGFVATENGLFKTKDGGISWYTLSHDLPIQSFKPSSGIITYIHPIKTVQTNDGNLIYVLYSDKGSEHQLFVTQNGGLNWEQVPYPKPYTAQYIKLTNSNQLILYNGYCIYKKNSPSDSFEQLSCPNSETINFVNNNLIYASPSHQNPLENFKKSIDGGKSWLSLSPFGQSYGARDTLIDAKNATTLFVVKDDSVGQTLVRSIDQGQSWVMLYETPKNEKLKKRITSLAHDKDYEYIGFSDGSIFRVNDGSINFDLYLSPLSSPKYDKIYSGVRTIRPGEKIWIGTNFGIYKKPIDDLNINPTSDSFFELNGFETNAIFKIINSDTIFTTQNKYDELYKNRSTSLLYRSSDDGTTWSPIYFDNSNRVISLIFSDLNEIYLLSQAIDSSTFLLYKSLDNGNSWNKIRTLKNFSCSAHGIIIKSDKIYCDSNFTSLFDDNDENHKVEIDGTPIAPGNFINTKNEILGIKNQGLYLSNDEGKNWKYKGRFYNDFCVNKLRYLNQDINRESCVYKNIDNFLYIRVINGSLIINNLTRYGENYEVHGAATFPCINPSTCDSRFHLISKSESEFYLLYQSNVYKSLDGGITWNKGIKLFDALKNISDLIIENNSLYFIYQGQKPYTKGTYKIGI